MNDDPLSRRGRSWPVPVLHVAPALHEDGPGRALTGLVGGLCEAGTASVVASPAGPLSREVERLGGVHVELATDARNPITIWRNAESLSRLIVEYGIGIVHVHRRAPAISVRRAADANGCHMVATVHRPYRGEGVLSRRLDDAALSADRVITFTDFMHAELVGNGVSDPGRIMVVRPGIETERYAPGRVSAARLAATAQMLNLGDDTHLLLMPTWPEDLDRFSVLCAALEKLDRPDVICLVTGGEEVDQSARKLLESRLLDLRGGGYVRVAAEQVDHAAVLLLAEAVVAPYFDHERTPYALIEAQASGRAVIACDESGATEYFVPRATGWSFEAGDAAGLADRLGHVLDLRSEDREAIAAAARTRSRAAFDRSLAVGKVLRLYRELVDGMPVHDGCAVS